MAGGTLADGGGWGAGGECGRERSPAAAQLAREHAGPLEHAGPRRHAHNDLRRPPPRRHVRTRACAAPRRAEEGGKDRALPLRNRVVRCRDLRRSC
jgi:hypothetical protein